MSYEKWITVDVYIIGREKKVCSQYDSQAASDGQIQTIKKTVERNGWKELSFQIPWQMKPDRNGKTERNWRLDFLRNEYEIRLCEDDQVDWFSITAPEQADDVSHAYVAVNCPHVSSILKKRNLFMYFDDENGIGTLRELAERALENTEWALGLVDTIYEADGTTEKIRSYECGEKHGAYNMISDLCDKFGAYPVYHGDTYTVDLIARANKPNTLEMRPGKNLKSMKRTEDSSDMVTRLYVEGEYGEFGYVGIDSVNPTGLNFLLNFDYYRQIGAFTEEHEAALTAYMADAKSKRDAIMSESQTALTNTTSLIEKWGSSPYAVYEVVNGKYANGYGGGGALEEEVQLNSGDRIAIIYDDGHYEYAEITSLSAPAGAVRAVHFLEVVAGTLGGKEVAIEAKQVTVQTLQADIDDAATDVEHDSLQEQLTVTQNEIAALQGEAGALMGECITLADAIHSAETNVLNLQNELEEVEQTFANAMGPMLQDGYYADDTYTVGQEQALYSDAVDVINVLAFPQASYSLSEVDLKNLKQYAMEDFQINTACHIINEKLGISDFGYVATISDVLDLKGKKQITIETDELSVGKKTFEAFMSRITDLAQMLKDEKSIYERAAAFSPNGLLHTEKLDGVIDVLRNQLVSETSNWYTDVNGNLILEAADGDSAMMLCGSGFMCADGKTADGHWNWRTFGTGKGFTADMITAGVLRAGVITILGSDQFLWNGDNLYVIDPDNSDRQIRIGRYDGEHLGIAYTQDNGATWQTAIGFDGVHLSVSDQTTLTNQSSQMTILEGQIATKVSQQDFNELGERVSSAETQITQKADSVTVTALQTTVDEVSGQVTENAAWIEANADKVASQITREEFDELGGMVTSNTSLIEQTAEAIRSEVSDTASGLQSQITQQAGQITTKASREELVTVQQAASNAQSAADEAQESANAAMESTGALSERVTRAEAEISVQADQISLSVQTATNAQNTANSAASAATSAQNTANGAASAATSAQNTANGAASAAAAANAALGDKLDADAPAVGVVTSGVTITSDQVKITSPETIIAIPSANGDEMAAQFDENGLTAKKIFCPNVASMYDGPKTLYVDVTFSDSYLENGKYEPGDCFRSLKDALAKLSYKFIPYHVSINVGGHYIMIEYGDMALTGCIATRGITISAYNGAYPALLCGQFTISGSLGFFNIRYINIKPPAAKHGIYAYGNGIYCYVTNCIITGTGLSSDTYGVLAADGAKIYARNCEFYNCECPFVSRNLGVILSIDNKGNCTPYIENATMHIYGTAPHSESNPSPYWVYIYGAYTLVKNGETVDQGSATSSTVTTTTANYLATSTASYKGSGSSYRTEVGQGWWDGIGRIRGCMWFNNTTIRSNLSGRTILSATLRLSMRSGVGRGASVTVELSGTVANSGASSAAVTKSYGTIGTTSPGEVTTITIPNGVITDLNNGTINGLMLYSSDTGAYKERSYSKNYAIFDGYDADDSLKPQLTIVYS